MSPFTRLLDTGPSSGRLEVEEGLHLNRRRYERALRPSHSAQGALPRFRRVPAPVKTARAVAVRRRLWPRD